MNKFAIKDIVKSAQANGASAEDILAFVLKTAAGETQLTDEDIAHMLQSGSQQGASPAGDATPSGQPEVGQPAGELPSGPSTTEPPAAPGAQAAGAGGQAPLQLSEEQIQEIIQIIMQALEGEGAAGGAGAAGAPPEIAAGAGGPPPPMPKTSAEKSELRSYVESFIKQGCARQYPIEQTVALLKISLDTIAQQNADQTQTAEQEKQAEAYFSGMLEQAQARGLTQEEAVAFIQKFSEETPAEGEPGEYPSFGSQFVESIKHPVDTAKGIIHDLQGPKPNKMPRHDSSRVMDNPASEAGNSEYASTAQSSGAPIGSHGETVQHHLLNAKHHLDSLHQLLSQGAHAVGSAVQHHPLIAGGVAGGALALGGKAIYDSMHEQKKEEKPATAAA